MLPSKRVAKWLSFFVLVVNVIWCVCSYFQADFRQIVYSLYCVFANKLWFCRWVEVVSSATCVSCLPDPVDDLNGALSHCLWGRVVQLLISFTFELQRDAYELTTLHKVMMSYYAWTVHEYSSTNLDPFKYCSAVMLKWYHGRVFIHLLVLLYHYRVSDSLHCYIVFMLTSSCLILKEYRCTFLLRSPSIS